MKMRRRNDKNGVLKLAKPEPVLSHLGSILGSILYYFLLFFDVLFNVFVDLHFSNILYKFWVHFGMISEVIWGMFSGFL